jgi:hypothetical protein
MTPRGDPRRRGVDVGTNFTAYKAMTDKDRAARRPRKGRRPKAARLYACRTSATSSLRRVRRLSGLHRSAGRSPTSRSSASGRSVPLVFNEVESEDGSVSIFPPSDVWNARHMQKEYNSSGRASASTRSRAAAVGDSRRLARGEPTRKNWLRGRSNRSNSTRSPRRKARRQTDGHARCRASTRTCTRPRHVHRHPAYRRRAGGEPWRHLRRHRDRELDRRAQPRHVERQRCRRPRHHAVGARARHGPAHAHRTVQGDRPRDRRPRRRLAGHAADPRADRQGPHPRGRGRLQRPPEQRRGRSPTTSAPCRARTWRPAAGRTIRTSRAARAATTPRRTSSTTSRSRSRCIPRRWPNRDRARRCNNC